MYPAVSGVWGARAGSQVAAMQTSESYVKLAQADPGAGLQGATRAPGGKGEPKGGGLEVGVEHRGPSVVLWLWEAISGGGEVVLRPQPIRFTAGPEGPPFKKTL